MSFLHSGYEGLLEVSPKQSQLKDYSPLNGTLGFSKHSHREPILQ